jgi:hypothetical protein
MSSVEARQPCVRSDPQESISGLDYDVYDVRWKPVFHGKFGSNIPACWLGSVERRPVTGKDRQERRSTDNNSTQFTIFAIRQHDAHQEIRAGTSLAQKASTATSVLSRKILTRKRDQKIPLSSVS